MPRIPTIAEVLPGALVNIVLKADQPTGRTVSGMVKDVLTRGNHPRGIKVRLSDGRIGRVQTMAANTNTTPFSANAFPTIDETETRNDSRPRPARHPRGGQFQDREQLPTSSIGLDAYVKPAKQRKAGRGRPRHTSSSGTADSSNMSGESAATSAVSTSTCPVCGDFEGDAPAVARHVASHFDD